MRWNRYKDFMRGSRFCYTFRDVQHEQLSFKELDADLMMNLDRVSGKDQRDCFFDLLRSPLRLGLGKECGFEVFRGAASHF